MRSRARRSANTYGHDFHIVVADRDRELEVAAEIDRGRSASRVPNLPSNCRSRNV